MKVKLLTLLGITVVPLLSVAQTGSVLYNKGKMSIVNTANDTTKTVLYVKGDFIVGRDATTRTTKSEIYVSGSKTVITGDFIQDMPYIDGDPEAQVFNLPANYATKSRFVFRGDNPQKIMMKTGNTYSAVGKGNNYINFPDIDVVNAGAVTVAPEIALSAQNVFLTRGKLILDSRRMKAGDLVTDPSGVTEGAATVANSTLLAHLNIPATGSVKYNKTTSFANVGTVQVRLALDEEVPESGWNQSSEQSGRSLVGMGSPFKNIKADYFMWNFLMFPYDNNIIGRLNTTETDPTVTIPAGKGFVLGVDLRGPKAANYTPVGNWTQTDFATRQTDMFVFDRFAYTTKNNIYPLQYHKDNYGNPFGAIDVTDPSNVYNDEVLTFDDVTGVKLIDGFNYLSNPYTTPLSLKQLTVASATRNDWGVISNVSGTTRDLINRVWILNPSAKASGLYKVGTSEALAKTRIHATYTYLLMQETGSTYSNAAGDGYTIAPLQMFVVYKPTTGGATTITIPQSERRINEGSQFLRSGNLNEPKDDFLFEVSDLKTNVYDRAAVVLRTPDELMTNNSYSNVKKLISSAVANETTKSMDVITEEGSVSQSANSVIYTKDDEGNALESYFLSAPESATTVTTPLYLTPSLTPQDISIRAMRLESMDRVNEIWLDDKVKNKSFLLSSGKSYPTAVKPTDKVDRFSLRFVFSSTGIGDGGNEGAAKSISSYYNNSTLYVTGFDEADINSLISVYDIQGRLIRQEKVNQLTMEIQEVFAPGAYIIKVVGNKSYVSKFLVR